MSASQLELLIAQAQIVLPLIKEFEATLGREKARESGQKAMEKFYVAIGQEIKELYPGNAIEQTAALTPYFAADNALEYEEIRKTSDTYEYRVTTCRYADYYKDLGETELGYIFVCAGDFSLAEGMSPDIELSRPDTIMQGADHCHFYYKLKNC